MAQPSSTNQSSRSAQVTPDNSKETEIHDNINNNNVHPDNLVVSVPANSQTRTQKELMWSGPMEMMMLDLYAEEVSKGQKADSGFQTSSH
ncbi:uncharacterized protein VP01_15171g1 [Puccinia sorghi]|uniref:Uncharacterized protein n=1 Tax=Puccinia sorghi TaxID=27349 RepID=A0A0L6VJ07_9BASI|nr:uncharacterized protein VP01_15171g1 [Puccinia sorghi]